MFLLTGKPGSQFRSAMAASLPPGTSPNAGLFLTGPAQTTCDKDRSLLTASKVWFANRIFTGAKKRRAVANVCSRAVRWPVGLVPKPPLQGNEFPDDPMHAGSPMTATIPPPTSLTTAPSDVGSVFSKHGGSGVGLLADTKLLPRQLRAFSCTRQEIGSAAKADAEIFAATDSVLESPLTTLSVSELLSDPEPTSVLALSSIHNVLVFERLTHAG
jgi:hypothetical protein